MRGFILAQSKPAEAAALVRKAIDASPQPESIYLMLSAIENLTPPKTDANDRALKVLDEAMAKYPDSIALVSARYRVLQLRDGDVKAVAYLQNQVKNDPKGDVRRLLVDVYRDAGRHAEAEGVLRELIALQPDDEELAAMLIRLVAFQAIDADTRGDRTAEASLNDKTARLIHEYRAKFPKEIAFIQAECELAARRGKYDDAVTLTSQIDELDKNSPVAPALRAEIAKAQGATQTMAEQYAEAVQRAPRRPDLRLALGEASLALGKTDAALKQAEWLLDSQANLSTAAVLLKARALAARQGTSAEVQAARTDAMRLLGDAIKAEPKFAAAYRLLADIYQRSNRRADAVKVLKACLAQVPDDNAGLSMLVQTLTEPQPGGASPSQADRNEAIAWAEKLGGKDETGNLALALAIGFHKAGQLDLALPWAEKAVEKLDSWLAHLNLGDLLLTKAESTSDKAAAQVLFQKASDQYDLVLKSNANSIEAVNNKAWILL
jgi:tetratricopeptide (TPR) repeat protein